jgi:hypothetical protein
MSMTNTKLGIAALLVIAATVAVVLVAQNRSLDKLREENQTLRQRAEQLEQSIAENQRLSKPDARAVPEVATTPSPSNEASREVLRLRGEVGRLHQEQASEAASRKTNAASPLSSLTSSPEMQKAIRAQQKAGMTMIYKDFVKQAKLSSDQAEKLQDLLADHVMDNIGQITAVLSEGKSQAEMDQVFKQQESALNDKVQALIGPDAFTQYQDYTRNLASYLTAEQFKGVLSGDKEAKDKQSKQLYQVMQEETQGALTQAGLGPDFQIVPTLNFRNFASEEEATKNLDLLDSIYDKVSVRAASFLSPDDLKKFSEFRTNAINGNRIGLAMNRKLMAPGAN